MTGVAVCNKNLDGGVKVKAGISTLYHTINLYNTTIKIRPLRKAEELINTFNNVYQHGR